MNKPYQSAPLSEQHLRLGLLLDFANNVNRGLDRKEMNPMGTLYVFDDHSEIRTPTVVPENWPHGLIRIYREQQTQGFTPEFTLQQFDPAMQTCAFDAKRSGGLDQQGIRFITQTGWHGLDAHYLVMPEFEQLSFIPLIGTHTDSVESILDQSKLNGYDRKIVRMTFEEAQVKEEYTSEDDLELYRGVPYTYHNWIMLNALIVAKIVTLRAIALAEAGENSFRETAERDSATGAVLPVDVSGEADQVDPAKIYVWEYLKYTEACACILSGMTQIYTPGTTRKSLVTDPKIRQLRDKLLVQYKDRLHDPATIAIIKGELSKVDREWIKGDDSEDYLIGKKNFDIVRMKTLLMHGEESAFGDGTSVTLIPTSLDEGLNLKNLPDYANSLREGSFNRGAQTALGGEAVQYLIRVFQNHAITEEDCGSILGIRRLINANKAERYVGYYIIEQGKTVALTKENISRYVNKYVQLRSPQRCRTAGAGYCARCMGDMNARFPNSLGGQASDMGSMMLYIFMGKAHGTALKTTRFDPTRHFT